MIFEKQKSPALCSQFMRGVSAVENRRISKDGMKTAALINKRSCCKIRNVAPDRRACVFYRSRLYAKCESVPQQGSEGSGWNQNMTRERSGKQEKVLQRDSKPNHAHQKTCSTPTVWTCPNPTLTLPDNY